MEEALIEKMRNGNPDFVDMAMIASRCAYAMQKMTDLCSKFITEFEKLTKEYSEELKLSGFACVFDVRDDVLARETESGSIVRIVYGAGEKVKASVDAIKEDLQ